MSETTKPRQAIRRFDVFAEYNRLKALKKGRPLDEAKGYGLWVAKVVAARRFAPSAAAKPRGEEERAAEAPEEHRYHTLDCKEQTGELFDRDIVDRMGPDFYKDVFAPTVARHFEAGDRYEAIRDSIRKNWKPGG